MRAGFKVQTDHGSLDVVVTLAEFMRWGRRENKPIASISENIDIDTWIEMIWWAATRTGQTSDSLDDFAASIVDIDRMAVDDPKAMTRGPGNGRSSTSKPSPERTGRTTRPKM